MIFPDHVFSKTSGKGQSDIIITETEGDEARDKIGHRRRSVNISNAMMGPLQHEDFETFCDLVEDEYECFLFLSLNRYKIENELIGIGNGVNKTFQLKRTHSFQGRTKETPIYCPDHDYLPRFKPTPEGMAPRRHWPRPGDDGLLHIFVNDIEYSIDVSTGTKLNALRYGGQVALNVAPPNLAEVRARGHQYHLMRFESGSPETTLVGGSVWQIDGAARLIEPKNIEKELAAIRAEVS